MSIVHKDKIWVEIAKNFEMQTSGGDGVVSDFGHPRTRWGGGQKGKFWRTSFMDGPKINGGSIKFRLNDCNLRDRTAQWLDIRFSRVIDEGENTT